MVGMAVIAKECHFHKGTAASSSLCEQLGAGSLAVTECQ